MNVHIFFFIIDTSIIYKYFKNYIYYIYFPTDMLVIIRLVNFQLNLLDYKNLKFCTLINNNIIYEILFFYLLFVLFK